MSMRKKKRELSAAQWTMIGVIVAALLGGIANVVSAFIQHPLVPTIAPTDTPAPTRIVMPSATATSTHTPSLTPAPTLTPTPTVTPTPTPDCKDIRVSYLEIDLIDGSGKLTTQKYPGTSIEINSGQISGLVNLSGRAILSGAHLADCPCHWQGKTDPSDSMRSIDSLTKECRFSIALPDPVTAIWGQLTIGGQTKLYTIRVIPSATVQPSP
jgi:hypothetical protein